MRADLRRYCNGLSLTDMFEGRVSPDEVWDCITHLPRTSALTAARLADPDTVLVHDEDAEVPWEEWTPEAQRLDDVYDALAVISEQIAKFGTGKPVKVKPRRRPGEARRKAAEKARFAEKWRKHKELAARFLGKKG